MLSQPEGCSINFSCWELLDLRLCCWEESFLRINAKWIRTLLVTERNLSEHEKQQQSSETLKYTNIRWSYPLQHHNISLRNAFKWECPKVDFFLSNIKICYKDGNVDMLREDFFWGVIFLNFTTSLAQVLSILLSSACLNQGQAAPVGPGPLAMVLRHHLKGSMDCQSEPKPALPEHLLVSRCLGKRSSSV